MPKCINDPKKSYKGTEPSPKGLGYCAHSEKVGTKKKGKDGNEWIIKKVSSGSKRWMKLKTTGEIKLFYKKKFGGTTFHDYGNEYKTEIGKVVGDRLFEWESYGKFSKVAKTVPKWESIDVPDRIVEEYMDGKNGKLMKELKQMSNKKHYYTHDNSGRPFLVYIIKGNILVYRIPKKVNNFKNRKADKSYDFMWRWIQYLGLPQSMLYSEKLLSFNKPKKIYIGESPKNPMTEYSGGHGDKFKGNSILLHLSGNKYVFIGLSIIQFSLQKGDSVEKYWSPVGNSDVPYPFIIGAKYIYFMMEDMYVSREYLPKDLTKIEMTDLFTQYYWKDEKRGTEPLSKHAKRIKIKLLEPRDF